MLIVWIILAVTLLSFAAEYLLSNCANRWAGLILPGTYGIAAIVFLLLNLLHAFPATEAFGSFLSAYGSAGFWALVLKIGFVLSPVIVHLILYGLGRHAYQKTHSPVKHNREYQKMIADDLE